MRSTDSLRAMTIYGTRPEAIKMAPLVAALRRTPHVEPVVISTGQHREMLDQVHALFGIESDYDLDLMAVGQQLSELTARAVSGLGEVVQRSRPDLIVVQGDTTTALCGALAAFYHRVPVVHLEAGLRTGDIDSPFPEEANRKLIGQVTRLHLAATPAARDNLLCEGVAPEKIVVTGNSVIDALLTVHGQEQGRMPSQLVGRTARDVVLVTAHRRESWGAGMQAIASAVAQLAARYDEIDFVLPMHRNPGVRAVLEPALGGIDNVVLCEPADYIDLVGLMARARLVLTDSGGIQEEAPALGKPVLVLRETTERPEGIAAGTARLVGTRPDRIVAEASALLDDPVQYAAMARAVNPYGDGKAAQRAVDAMLHCFGNGQRPGDFSPTLETP